MGCDNYPVSRREIIYSAARAKVIPSFVLPQVSETVAVDAQLWNLVIYVV